MSLRDYGSQFTNAGAQSAGTTPTASASPTLMPGMNTPGAATNTGAGLVDPNSSGASLPQTPNSTGFMSNLNSNSNNYGGGYTGFGNSVMTPQAQSAQGGGNTSGVASTPPGINGAPPGMYTNQASQLNTNYGPNVHGGAMNFLNNFNASHPLMNLTAADFNRANQQNSGTAFQMLSQGGQQFRNAVMQANGWNQNQMNQWLNQVAYENPQTFNPVSGAANSFANFGAQQAQPTHAGPQGYAYGFTGPQRPTGPLGYTNYTQSPTYTGGPVVPDPVNRSAVIPSSTSPNKVPVATNTSGNVRNGTNHGRIGNTFMNRLGYYTK